MTLLTTDWGQAWAMAGVSVGIVFCILLLLVGVLVVFSAVAEGRKEKPVVAAALDAAPTPARTTPDDEAAVAMAVYLYMNGRHDEESGVLTIHVNHNSLWHEELNERL